MPHLEAPREEDSKNARVDIIQDVWGQKRKGRTGKIKKTKEWKKRGGRAKKWKAKRKTGLLLLSRCVGERKAQGGKKPHEVLREEIKIRGEDRTSHTLAEQTLIEKNPKELKALTRRSKKTASN